MGLCSSLTVSRTRAHSWGYWQFTMEKTCGTWSPFGCKVERDENIATSILLNEVLRSYWINPNDCLS
ncbi:hypothetical protein V1505DRAFT_367070 [Lipomyces doorenjongii]